ncbi:MAG: hypothetical protein LBN31_05840 [Hungatella sp.]|jgi:hypothetical protein|nr:hypothetical protein [Hungatella sp.]
MFADLEYSNRKSNRLKRLIRNAGFDQPEAHISDINYTSAFPTFSLNWRWHGATALTKKYRPSMRIPFFLS